MKHNEPKFLETAFVQKEATGTLDLLFNQQRFILVDENNKTLGKILFRNADYETGKFNAYILIGIEEKEVLKTEENYLLVSCTVTRTEITGVIVKSQDYRIQIKYAETSKPLVTDQRLRFPHKEEVFA